MLLHFSSFLSISTIFFFFVRIRALERRWSSNVWKDAKKKVTPPFHDKLCKLKDIIGTNDMICFCCIAFGMDIEWTCRLFMRLHCWISFLNTCDNIVWLCKWNLASCLCNTREAKKKNNASKERTIDGESRGFVFVFHSPRVSRAFRSKLPGPLFSFPPREEKKQRLGPMLIQLAWDLV